MSVSIDNLPRYQDSHDTSHIIFMMEIPIRGRCNVFSRLRPCSARMGQVSSSMHNTENQQYFCWNLDLTFIFLDMFDACLKKLIYYWTTCNQPHCFAYHVFLYLTSLLQMVYLCLWWIWLFTKVGMWTFTEVDIRASMSSQVQLLLKWLIGWPEVPMGKLIVGNKSVNNFFGCVQSSTICPGYIYNMQSHYVINDS